MSRGKRLIVALAAAAALTLGAAGSALANPGPPTNGGNGAGQSGQCTGNPDLRPPGLSCS
jgi:Spy/CpxP family protein refolding chaperone